MGHLRRVDTIANVSALLQKAAVFLRCGALALRATSRRGQPQQILARLRWRGLIPVVKRRSLCYDRWCQQRWVSHLETQMKPGTDQSLEKSV